MNKKGLLTTILSLAIIALAGITCFAVVDKASTSTINKTSTTTQSGPTGLLNLGDKWDINLKYTPDEQSAKAGVVQQVYEYEFQNGLSKNLLIKLISEPALDNMTVNFAYSTTQIDDYTTLVGGKYEDKIIAGGTNQYVYLIATVSDTSQIATYGDSIEWQMGTPVTLTYNLSNGTTTTGYAVMGAPTPNLLPPEVNESTFVGWYTDSNYTKAVTFPLTFTTGQTLYAKYSSPYLPSDWLAWDSTTSSYYVQKGTSTLPAELKIQSTYNDGTHGTANVTYIASGADSSTSVFYAQSSTLKSVTLPDTLTSIGDYAFYDCRVLTSITIPSSVTSIGNSAFFNCLNLTGVTFGDNSQLTSIGSNAFQFCSKLTSITIPSSVTSIGGWAFQGCSLLTSVTLPSGITIIEESTFRGCESLTSVSIPNGVTSIGNCAFFACFVLTNITIPASVTEIYKEAFVCSLTNVTFEGLEGYNWYRAESLWEWENGTKITEDLSDPSVAATCLTTYYSYYYWYKVTN